MKFYKNITNLVLILFIFLYPILPTYGKYNSDIILYFLITLNIIGFLFIKNERTNIINNIKTFPKSKILMSLLALNLIMYISTFIALNKRLSFTSSIRFSFYIFIFYSITYTLKNKKQISIILYSFIFTAVLSSFVSIFEILKLTIEGYKIDVSLRMVSFLENANNLGAYSLLSFFIILMLMIKADKKSKKFFFLFLSLLLLFNILSSQSRNALLGLLLGSLLLAVLYDKRFLTLSIIFPIIIFIIPQSRARILQIFDPVQNSSRFKIWESAKLMINDHPIFGVGYNNFQTNYPIYVNNNNESLFISDGYLPLHPHNIFLNIQAELGVFGTLAFIFFLIVTTFTLLHLIKSHIYKNTSGILIGITCGFISLQFMNLIDNFYNAPKVAMSMFVILGIANYYKMYKYTR